MDLSLLVISVDKTILVEDEALICFFVVDEVSG
jgi:hypothetical protein